MINWLLSRVQRPERGWDPVPATHAEEYGREQWQTPSDALVDELDRWVQGLAGKRVLDLGGGPGHYTVAFARRGAQVTWYDVSRNYREMANAKAAQAGVAAQVMFCMGYLDEAPHVLAQSFDLVFNRLCWYYGRGDASFADVVYQLVAPGGSAYIDTTNSGFGASRLSASARFRTWLNSTCGIKIGHPYPPRGRVARLLLRQPIARMALDYSSDVNDRVFFEKPRQQP